MNAYQDDCYALSCDQRGVARLELRAGKANILGWAEIRSLSRAIHALRDIAGLRCLVILGRQHVFIGGANIKDMLELEPESAQAFIRELAALCDSVRELPVPVIAQVQGWCLGAGVEFIAACDIRIAADARFAMPEVRLGLPSVIHAALLPRQIGAGRARAWLLSGQTIDAAKALSWGLVDEVVEKEELDAAVENAVAGLLQCPAHALRIQKTLCNAWDESASLADNIALTVPAFGATFHYPEARQAMRDFLGRNKERS